MDDQHLLYQVENGIGTITINREQQRNAITPEAIIFSTPISIRPKRMSL